MYMKSIPLEPHFYLEKLGFAGVNLDFIFCSKTKIVGIIYVLSKNKKKIYKNSSENFPFLQLKRSLYIT